MSKLIINEKRNIRITKKKKWDKSLNFQLLVLSFPATVLIFVFSYLPMVGLILAFKKFNVQKGIFGSPWSGFDNFKFFFSSQDATRVLFNTIYLNFLFLIVGTILSIIFALLLFEIKQRWVVKSFQTVFVLPSLVSWVVVGYISYAFFQPQSGMLNHLLSGIGLAPISWYAEPQYWPWILMFFAIWKGLGMSILYYYASLMGIDGEVFEAAKLDGANRMQIAVKISLPFLIPTVIILTIIHIGSIFRSDFGLFYNLTQDIGLLYPTTDVIDTYIYRALSKMGNIGMSSAIGLFQSVVGFVLILLTNSIVKKIDKDKALF